MKELSYSDVINGGLEFEHERFSTPDNCFYPVFSWIWNDVLDQDKIKNQIDEMAEGGIRCFYIIPEPKNFRPHTMATNLEPDYLTDEFMEYIKFTADYANSKGMYMWLYDEGGWPSGGASGKVSLKEPKTVIKNIERRESILKQGNKYLLSNDVKAAFFEDKRLYGGEVFDSDIEITEYYIKKAAIDPIRGSLTDLTEKLTTETFINITHEKYKEYIGEHFGKTVPFMFTDEPKASMPSFCEDFQQCFQEKYGYDITDKFPVLFKPQGESQEENKIRIDYYTLCGEIFNENFLKAQGDWCKKNNLLITGHLDNDHQCDFSVNHGYTSYPDSLSKLHMPGIDVIWRQIDYGKGVSEGTSFFPRFAASAAIQNERNLTVSESFGVYGSGYTYNEMRYVLNYQFLRGINIINFMNISYGREKHLAFAERPSFGKEKPGYENLKKINDFSARMTYLSTLGRSGAETILYIPQNDFRAGGKIRQKAIESFNEIGKHLENNGVDFIICDDSAIRNAKITPEGLKIGRSYFKYVYIPKNEYIPTDIKAKLLPYISKAIPVCGSSNGFSEIRASKRILENGDILYLFVNESGKLAETHISFKDGKKYTFELEPLSGKIHSASEPEDLNISLEIGESICFLRTDKRLDSTVNPKKINFEKTVELKNFESAVSKSFILDKTSGRAIYPDYKPQKTELGSWENLYGKDFSGDIVYKTDFELDFEPIGASMISLGKVEHSASVKINGEFAGCAVFKPMEIYSHSKYFKKGKNTIEITVSNTAANQFVLSDADKLFEQKEIGPYNEKSKEAEKEHLDGGLYGPVLIKFVK